MKIGLFVPFPVLLCPNPLESRLSSALQIHRKVGFCFSISCAAIYKPVSKSRRCCNSSPLNILWDSRLCCQRKFKVDHQVEALELVELVSLSARVTSVKSATTSLTYLLSEWNCSCLAAILFPVRQIDDYNLCWQQRRLPHNMLSGEEFKLWRLLETGLLKCPAWVDP